MVFLVWIFYFFDNILEFFVFKISFIMEWYGVIFNCGNYILGF